MIKEKILNGEVIEAEQVEAFKLLVREDFKKKGNKHWIEILAKEFKNVPLSVKVNVAGKQKNLGMVADKLSNLFRVIISNPAILQSPPMAKLFNQIVESSGLEPLDFSGFTAPTAPTAPLAPQGIAPQPSPIQPQLA